MVATKQPPETIASDPHHENLDGADGSIGSQTHRLTRPADAAQALDAPMWTVVVFVTLLPFLAIPIAHVATDSQTASGFFQYELPYYFANGRSAFERGNGVFYPNPYDPDAASPNIYVHWLPWILGYLTAKVGLDPGDLTLAATFFASIVFAVTTGCLVRLRTSRCSRLAFLMAMWGGGLLTIAGSLQAIASGDWLQTVLQFDPGQGMWFLNWGRNALFPTEAIYHALVAACWVSEIRGRQALANVFLLLLATTHPWSGLELLLTINLWRGGEWLRCRNSTTRNQLSISVTVLAVFLGYYKVWLPSFPRHAQLQSVWELNWSLSWVSAVLAYLPVVIPCAVLLRKRWRARLLNDTERFLLCALTVAVGLAFHDRLIKPVQPLHFTRGYVWMPLFLLGLPQLVDWWEAMRTRRNTMAVAASAAIVLVACSDNWIFAMVHCKRQWTHQDGFHLNSSDRALCASLHAMPQTVGKVVLTDSATLNYLLPTYAAVRPWLGHHFNTPGYPDRKETWRRCFVDGGVAIDEIPGDVDVLAVRRTRDIGVLQNSRSWRPLDISNGDWVVWKRADD